MSRCRSCCELGTPGLILSTVVRLHLAARITEGTKSAHVRSPSQSERPEGPGGLPADRNAPPAAPCSELARPRVLPRAGPGASPAPRGPWVPPGTLPPQGLCAAVLMRSALAGIPAAAFLTPLRSLLHRRPLGEAVPDYPTQNSDLFPRRDSSCPCFFFFFCLVFP